MNLRNVSKELILGLKNRIGDEMFKDILISMRPGFTCLFRPDKDLLPVFEGADPVDILVTVD